MESVPRLASRVRAAVFTVITATFTIILAISAVRIAPSAAWYETAIVVGLAVGLGFATRRWYRLMTRERRNDP